MSNTQTQTELYDYLDWKVYANGVCTHKGKPVEWFKDKDGKPWIPDSRKLFIWQVKSIERDGDIVYLQN